MSVHRYDGNATPNGVLCKQVNRYYNFISLALGPKLEILYNKEKSPLVHAQLHMCPQLKQE